jgi:hypothetical protein
MSYIRILNEAGSDVLRIDMGSGRVEILKPGELGDAARAFWDAIDTIGRSMSPDGSPRFRNLVFQDVGESGHALPNGDVIVRPGRAASPRPKGSGGNVVLTCSTTRPTP